jgi:Flp pilus assembly protein TadD
LQPHQPEKPGIATAIREGLALFKAGRLDEAEAFCKRVLENEPQNADIWNLRGVVARQSRWHAEAIAFFRRGITISQNNPSLWTNLGNALKDVKQCDSAVVCHRRALALEPDSATTLHNLGIALSAGGKEHEALSAYDQAIKIAPGNPDIRWDRAFAHLRLGDYVNGWKDYESRIARRSYPKRNLPGSKWTGERYEGKRLLVVSEQGLGDTIWIARYLKQVKALGGQLIVECRPEVSALIDSMGIADVIVPKRDPLPDADFHVLQCSLPGIFNDISAAPYLTPSREHMERLSAILSDTRGKLRVGIVWGGSVSYAGRADRDAPLALFMQWLSLPNVQLFSLQKGPQEADLKSLPPGAPIINLTPHTANLAETAAAVASLDLIIMTDTAVAHLAGALGKPVWLLLNRVPHWLWRIDRDDTPWYPSMRLFRQRAWGDWNGVFDQAAAALMAFGQRST